MERVVPAGKFKAECLRLMDEVNATKAPITITKHGVPVAQLVPIPGEKRKLYGWMRGTGKVVGDIISPIDEEWDASR